MPYKPSPNGHRDPRTTFTTLSGVEINFKPFSWDEYQLEIEGLRQEWRERGEQIDCPQYDVKLASGETAKFVHDANTIDQVPPETPEDQKESIIEAQHQAWDRYHETLKRFESVDGDIKIDFIFYESLGHIQDPGDTYWQAKRNQKHRRHVTIPDDPEERRRQYILTDLLPSRADQLDLISTIVAVSMGVVKEADVEALRNSFRDQLYGNIEAKLRNATIQAENTADGKVEEQ